MYLRIRSSERVVHDGELFMMNSPRMSRCKTGDFRSSDNTSIGCFPLSIGGLNLGRIEKLSAKVVKSSSMSSVLGS